MKRLMIVALAVSAGTFAAAAPDFDGSAAPAPRPAPEFRFKAPAQPVATEAAREDWSCSAYCYSYFVQGGVGWFAITGFGSSRAQAWSTMMSKCDGRNKTGPFLRESSSARATPDTSCFK